MVKAGTRFSLWFILALGGIGLNAYAEDKSLSFGIFPFFPQSVLMAFYQPVANDLSAALGVAVDLKIPPSYATFLRDMTKQQYDVVIIQPFDYIKADIAQAYIPVAKLNAKLAASYYVRLDDSLDYEYGAELSILRGKTIVMPPATSAVSRLAIKELACAGLQPEKDFEVVYVRSHFYCYQQLILGDADVCVSASAAFNLASEQLQSELLSFHSGRKIPHVMFAVKLSMPSAQRSAIRARVLSWGKTSKSVMLLENARIRGFIAASDVDYDVVREIDRGDACP